MAISVAATGSDPTEASLSVQPAKARTRAAHDSALAVSVRNVWLEGGCAVMQCSNIRGC